MPYASNEVDIKSTFLINGLLRGVSHEKPLDLTMLRKNGISPALAAHYARTGWLERLTTGVYCVAGARLDRDQSLIFLQGRIEGLHVGGRTALAWQGVRQYLEAQERLSMWAATRGDLPEWFTERFPGHLKSLSLFDDATKESGIIFRLRSPTASGCPAESALCWSSCAKCALPCSCRRPVNCSSPRWGYARWCWVGC